jgi:hypothetical protein
MHLPTVARPFTAASDRLRSSESSVSALEAQIAGQIARQESDENESKDTGEVTSKRDDVVHVSGEIFQLSCPRV